MKKILIPVAVLAGYSLFSLGAGYIGQQQMRAALFDIDPLWAERGLELRLDDYQRGLFRSTMALTIDYRDLLPDWPELQVTARADIRHGPLLWLARGLRLGWLGADVQLHMDTGNPELDQWLADNLGESLGELVLAVEFGGSLRLDWRLPALAVDQPHIQFSLGETRLQVRSPISAPQVSAGEVHLGALHLSAPQAAQLTLAPTRIRFDLRYLNPLVSVGEVHMDSEQLTWAQPGGFPLVFRQPSLHLDQQLVDGRINLGYQLRIAEVEGSPLPLSELSYRLGLNQLDVQALEQWLRLSADPEQVDEAQGWAVLEQLLQPGVQATLHTDGKLMGHQLRLDFVADYVGFADGRRLRQVEDEREYLALVNASLEVRGERAVVEQTPLILVAADYIDNYLLLEGDSYVLRARLEGGRLTIADIPFPLEFLFPDP